MGVLHVRAPSLDEPTLRRCQTLASLLALIVTSKRAYSDTYVRHTRTRPVQLRTEMLRAFLPPRTLGTTRGVSTAVLEPAPETLRRLIHAIHAHKRGSFNDDATIMLLEWHPEGTGVPRPRGG